MAPQEHRIGEPAEWIVHGERALYESRWVRLHLVDVEMPDGTRFEHHVVRMQRVAVSAVMNDVGDQLLMLRRHRFIDGSWGWEVPVGIVEPGEEPIAAAAREVEEETGWRPAALRKVLTFQPAIGIADTPHELFTGHDAVRIGDPADMTEAAEVAWIPTSSLPGMVEDGSIRDGATLVAVLHFLALRPSL
jgi:8-oxo-dGTP pyrophosphatase MutT (NUDIX family)